MNKNKNRDKNEEQLVQVSIGQAILEGNLNIPKNPKGIVLFAHGSGSRVQGTNTSLRCYRLRGLPGRVRD